MVGLFEPAVVGTAVHSVARQAHQLFEIFRLAQIGLLEFVDLYEQMRAGRRGALAYDDVGRVPLVRRQRRAAHVFHDAQTRRRLLADMRVFYGGELRAGQFVSVIFYAFSGALQKGQRVLLLHFEYGFLEAFAGAFQLREGDLFAFFEQQAQRLSRRLQHLAAASGLVECVGQFGHTRVGEEQSGVGKEGALIVKSATHTAKNELLSLCADFGGNALDIVAFDISIIGSKDFIQAQSLVVGIDIAGQHFAGGSAVIGEIEAVLPE